MHTAAKCPNPRPGSVGILLPTGARSIWNLEIVWVRFWYSIVDFASCVWGPDICQVKLEAWSVTRCWLKNKQYICQLQYAQVVVTGAILLVFWVAFQGHSLSSPPCFHCICLEDTCWNKGKSNITCWGQGWVDDHRVSCTDIQPTTVHAITPTTLLKEMMLTCFLNTCKHRGYVLHGYGWVGKYCKHPGGQGTHGQIYVGNDQIF